MKSVSKSNQLISLGGDRSPSNGAENGIAMTQPYSCSVTIEGVAPILFHAWNCESVESKGKAAKGSKEKKSDDVESYVYRNDKKEICVPGEYLRGAIIGAAKFQQDPRANPPLICSRLALSASRLLPAWEARIGITWTSGG